MFLTTKFHVFLRRPHWRWTTKLTSPSQRLSIRSKRYNPRTSKRIPSGEKIMKIVNYWRKMNKNLEKTNVEKQIFQKTWKKHVLVLASWINVWAIKSFFRWTKLIDHEEISSKTCSQCFFDSHSPLKFQFYKIAFLIFCEIYFNYFHDFCSYFYNK